MRAAAGVAGNVLTPIFSQVSLSMIASPAKRKKGAKKRNLL